MKCIAAWLLTGGVTLSVASPAGAGQAVTLDGPAPPVPPAIISRDASGRATIRAVRLTTPIRIDGALDEPIYTMVPPITDFIQQEPVGGEPATETTELWVAFDEDNMYVLFRCWETDASPSWPTRCAAMVPRQCEMPESSSLYAVHVALVSCSRSTSLRLVHLARLKLDVVSSLARPADLLSLELRGTLSVRGRS